MDQTVVLCTLAAFLVYYNTLGADFAYDDSRAIRANPDVQWTTPWTGALFNDFWGTPLTHSGSHKSYRPLCVLSFRANHWLHEFRPFGYHLANVLLHCAATALFTRLARSLLPGRAELAAGVAGALFAAHPVHTEAVAGIVGRADIGAAVFFMLAFSSYRRYANLRSSLLRPGTPRAKPRPADWRALSLKKWAWMVATVACAACSMLTKEHGVTVLAVCALYDVFVHSRLRPRDLCAALQKRRRGLVEGLATLSVSAAVLVAVRLQLMGSKAPEFAPADNPSADCPSRLTRTLTFLYLPAFNFWLLLQPSVLSFDWSMEAIPLVQRLADPRNLATLALYGAVAYAAWSVLLARRAREEDDQWPSSSQLDALFDLLPDDQANGNENGSCCKFTCASGDCGASSSSSVRSDASAANWSRCRAGTDLTVIALSMLVVPFVPATNLFFYVGFVVAERVLYIPSIGYCLLVALGFHLTDDWLGKRRRHARRLRFLWRFACFALLALFAARTVRRNADWLSEETLYRSGIKVNPPKAYGNLANILSSTGRKEEAEWAYKKALTYRNNMADVHYNLGILYQEQRRYEEAIQSYRLAIHYRPRMAMAHLNMGLVLALVGLKEEAVEVYRRCSTLDGAGLKDPRTHETTKISALFNLGRLYADDGQYAKAIDVYTEAVQRMPPHYQPQSLYNMLGEAYFKLDRLKEAEHWYREALRVKPDHVPAHLTYGKLLAKLSRQKEAEDLFQRAKSLAPNDSTVYQHYGQFLSESERHAEAAEQFVRAASLAPHEYEIVFNAANTLRQAGRHAEAEQYYRAAVRIRPHEATSHMNLGAMLHVNGKLAEAEQSYLEALRLKPDDHITQTNLQKLRHLLVKKGMTPSTGGSRRR